MSQSRADSTHSLGEIARGLASDVQDLIRGEISLARAELDQKLQRVVMASVWLLGGALLGAAGLIVTLLGIAAVLGRTMPIWAALLIVGSVVIIAGAVFVKCGMGMLSVQNLTPERTVANLQKDAVMLKEHT